MDNATETILLMCKCLQSIMPVNNMWTEKQHEANKALMTKVEVNEAKFRSNQYIDDATQTILPICEYLQSIMNAKDIGTEK